MYVCILCIYLYIHTRARVHAILHRLHSCSFLHCHGLATQMSASAQVTEVAQVLQPEVLELQRALKQELEQLGADMV